MIPYKIIYVLGFFCHISLSIYLNSNFLAKPEVSFDEETDAVRHIKIAKKAIEGKVDPVPHWISRTLIYRVLSITQFPPTFWQSAMYQIVNSCSTGLLIFYLIKEINILFAINSKKNIFVIWLISFFSPGVLFLSATMRSEIFSILLIYLCIKILINNDHISLAKPVFVSLIGLLARPTGIFTPLFFYIFRKKNPFIFVVFLMLICGGVLFFCEKTFKFLDGPHYAYQNYNDSLRNTFNIKILSDSWKIPFKIFISYFLDGFSPGACITAVQNPENLNNVAASIRVLCIFFIFLNLKTFYFIKQNLLLFKLYCSYTFPLICFSGFYQTRYFIAADTLLFSSIICTKLKTSRNY